MRSWLNALLLKSDGDAGEDKPAAYQVALIYGVGTLLVSKLLK